MTSINILTIVTSQLIAIPTMLCACFGNGSLHSTHLPKMGVSSPHFGHAIDGMPGGIVLYLYGDPIDNQHPMQVAIVATPIKKYTGVNQTHSGAGLKQSAPNSILNRNPTVANPVAMPSRTVGTMATTANAKATRQSTLLVKRIRA